MTMTKRLILMMKPPEQFCIGWKNQWQGSSLRIPTGKITWEHNDNITAAALHITVNSSRLHWQRQCHACKLTRKSSWGNSIKTVTHSIFCFSSLKNYLIPLLSFQSDVSLRAIKPKAALVEMQHRGCFHCTHSPCNAQQSFGNHCCLPKKKGKESKKISSFSTKDSRFLRTAVSSAQMGWHPLAPDVMRR